MSNATPKSGELVLSVTSDQIMVANIPIANLELGTFSPRMQFDPKYIDVLAKDLKAWGQHKPILVRPHPTSSNKYQVVDGEHRVRALRKIGQALVRAEVHMLSDEEAFFRAMRINQLHGKPLEELEEACHINKMIAVFGYTEEQVAKRFKKSQQWVSQRRSLAVSIDSKVEDYVTRRLVTSSHAVELAELPKEDQTQIVDKIVEKRLPVRATRVLVHAYKEAKTPEEKQHILSKPVKVYSSLYNEAEALKRSLTTKPDQPVFQVLTCPVCGNKVAINWNSRTFDWEGKNK